ncbi:MAG TPA: toll/interleukin-1 receptor domain-containing protein [Archangium sp.]|nr:toll/interleukin-1 receptor domain-containing protein [Archangium sp.]
MSNAGVAQPLFISYARGSAETSARALHAALGEELAFLDSRGLEPGDPIPEDLLDALLGSRAVVLFLDERYLQRWYCLWELRAALQPYLLLPVSASEPEKRAALAHIIVARSGPSSLLEHLPPQLRNGVWPAQEDASALKALSLEVLARMPLSLGDRLSQLENLPALRARLLEETAISSPKRLVGMPQFPYDLEPSIQHRFVGRADELWRIDFALSTRSGGPMAAALTTGLEGGGGVGKTRLALEYLHRFGPRRFPGGLFWVDADVSEDRLEEQFHGILQELEPSTPPLKVFREQERRASNELARALNRQSPEQPILYVVDNIPEPPANTPPRQLRAWCPAPSKVALLVTSRVRFSVADKSLQAVQVDSLSPESAVLLLTDGVDSAALQASEWREIAAWVGYLPLALQLLNGAMAAGGLSPTELLARSRTQGLTEELDRQMTALRRVVTSGKLRGVTEAFLLSFQRLSPVEQASARLLAQLGPEPIPEGLLSALGPDVSSSEVRNSLRVRSFVGSAGSSRVPLYGAMHRVLADFLRSMAAHPDAELHQACEAVISLMKERDAADSMNWPLLEACLPHAEALFERAVASVDETLGENAVRLGLLIGILLAERGLPHKARLLNKRVVGRAEKTFGPEHRITLSANGNLAYVMHEVGDSHEALKLQQSVLEAQRRTLGLEHHNTLVTLNNLAQTLLVLGDEAKALQYLEQVIAVRHRHLGETHRETLAALNNLNAILHRVGRTREAREGQQWLLEQQTPLLGEEHPYTLKAKSNLGLYILNDEEDENEEGRIAQARSIFESVLAARVRLLGEEHPDTLEVMANLAGALYRQGAYAAARELQEKELAVLLARLGEHTYETISSRQNLAVTMSAQGDYSNARVQFEHALESSKQFYGPNHPRTALAARFLSEMFAGFDRE